MIPDRNTERKKGTPRSQYMGKYKERLTVSNKINTYLVLSLRNAPTSYIVVGRSTLAGCFFICWWGF